MNAFQVAEDYSEIKTEVSALKQQLAEVTVEMGSIRARLSAIEKAVNLGEDISRAELVQVFEQSNLLLTDGAKRSLEELENFHRTLLEDRRSRFEDERDRLRERERVLEEKRSSLAGRHRELLQYLDSHGALEEYQALSKQLGALRARLEKLLSYQEILETYRNEVLRSRHEQIEQNEAAEQYLQGVEPLIDANLQVFRNFSSRFYENRAGGVIVKNNDGRNQLRFEIQCHLADDASSGINEVKIFCYDAMVLSSRHNHEVEFLFHDSTLYSNMDPRQRSILFETAAQLCKEETFQYLATINQDALESIKTELGHDTYVQLIEPSIILRLTDNSDAEKLLGIHVDLEYDR